MKVFSWIIVLSVTVTVGQCQDIIPAVISGSELCSSSDLQESIRRNITESSLEIVEQTACGGSLGWTRLIDLDLSDPSQDCPSSWTLFTTPVRSCSIFGPDCRGISIPAAISTYTRVCGRVTGYSIGTPDGFWIPDTQGLQGRYVDGVSLTFGSPRQHIWTFVAGACPCNNADSVFLPPDFVGEDYFCDGRQNGAFWDGEDCTDACCTFNSPPYFTVTLPAPTSDDLEVRICANQNRGDEGVHVGFLQLYVK